MAGGAVGGLQRHGLRIAHRLQRQRARRGDRLVHERRSHLQQLGVGVEVVLQLVLRQPGGGVDVEVQQVTHGIGVLAAIQASQRHIAGVGCGLGFVQRAFQPGNHACHGGVLGLRFARRRHQAAAEFLDGGFPDLGVLGDGVRGHGVEGYTARPVRGVVTLEAVVLDQFPLGLAIGGGRPVADRWQKPAWQPLPTHRANSPQTRECRQQPPSALQSH